MIFEISQEKQWACSDHRVQNGSKHWDKNISDETSLSRVENLVPKGHGKYVSIECVSSSQNASFFSRDQRIVAWVSESFFNDETSRSLARNTKYTVFSPYASPRSKGS